MNFGLVGHIAALIGLDLVLLIGLLFIPLGLGGNFILLGVAVVVALLTGFTQLGWWALGIMLGAVVAGEVLEAVLGSLVARKYGASKWGMLGAFAGGILGDAVGTGVLPVVGSLIGSFVGAAAGALAAELLALSASGQEIHGLDGTRPGLRAGFGALLGKALATGLKMAIGVAMAIYIVMRTHGASAFGGS